MKQPDRILIFGGTFDPPHRAHVLLPPLVAQQLCCQRILYIPAAINPLKADTPPTADHHRLAMLQAALDKAGDEHDVAIEIDTLELNRPGPSYMVDTLRELRDRFGPDTQLRLLIGADQAVQFHRWRDWTRIIEIATPVVMLRPPFTKEAYVAALQEHHDPSMVDRWLNWTIPLPMIDVSSTEIRRRIIQGDDISDILSPSVIQYITEHELYRE